MLWCVEPLPYRIEALSRPGQFAVGVLVGGQEHTIVMEVVDGVVVVAAAGLIDGWTDQTESYAATVDAVLALHRAREHGVQGPQLVDVDGGWDVTLGNVALSPAGTPACAAHGDLQPEGDDIFVCPECGAKARYGVLG